jgi:hypothetical protein
MANISWSFPLRTVSEMNCSQHWGDKSARHKKQKLKVKTVLKKGIGNVTLPCHIKLTRLSAGKMDYDNLCASQKYVVDAICELLIPGLATGRADGDERIKVSYYQEKARKHSIKVEIEY